MLFASKSYQGRNSDPEPWAYSRTSKPGVGLFGTPDRAATRVDKAMLYFARGEYQYGTLPENRVLVSFRGAVNLAVGAHGDKGLGYAVEEYLYLLDNHTADDFASTEELVHARRVLELLSALGVKS